MAWRLSKVSNTSREGMTKFDVLIVTLFSHTNSELPGQIHEGGELGYALAVSFGAALDKPDLIVTCIVGG
jgi:phosphoketolase